MNSKRRKRELEEIRTPTKERKSERKRYVCFSFSYFPPLPLRVAGTEKKNVAQKERRETIQLGQVKVH